jgi:hypothetical protein
MPADEIQYTLLTDGPADKALIPILTWLLHQHLPNCAVQASWADLGRVPKLPKTLHEKIQISVRLYPCNLIFVHRDAERLSLLDRKVEVDAAVNRACATAVIPPAIAVVPVRMTETWLLLDAQAIREAAGNPNGSVPLNLPQPQDLENVSRPETMLHNLILTATELGAHRRRQFEVNRAVKRISDCVEDFAPLRALPAFSALEQKVIETIRQQGWGT